MDDVIATGFIGDDFTIIDKKAHLEHRNATRRGGYDALNLYFYSELPMSLGGQCTFPMHIEAGDIYNATIDGCMVNGNVMPGLSTPFGEHNGRYAVHEAGHWFNLLHTFTGAPCDLINDEVDDTPAQAGPSSGCSDPQTDTCPDLEGLDPIHNYMDYAGDSW